MNEVYQQANPWWYKIPPEPAWIQRTRFLKPILDHWDHPQIQILIGSRRVGKTTLLKQVLFHLLTQSKIPGQQVCYLSLDHPKLHGTPLSQHVQNFRQLFRHPREQKLWLFLDEVQESPQWQAELKSLYDAENVKIFCSGSTATLIERHQGKLTGRQICHTINLLSFSEFLSFRKQQDVPPSEPYRMVALCEDYLQTGGYPDQVLQPSDLYLANLLEDILARDIERIFKPRKPYLLKDLLKLLATSVTNRLSFNKMAHTLGVTSDTIKDYIHYFQSAFLLGSLDKFSGNINDRIYSGKKIYFADTGIKLMLSALDFGALAENACFNWLHFQNVECGYYAELQKEVDFVCRRQQQLLPVESKYMSHVDFSEERWQGLKLFFKRKPEVKTAVIVTKDVSQTFEWEGKSIVAVPLWKFLSEPLPALLSESL